MDGKGRDDGGRDGGGEGCAERGGGVGAEDGRGSSNQEILISIET